MGRQLQCQFFILVNKLFLPKQMGSEICSPKSSIFFFENKLKAEQAEQDSEETTQEQINFGPEIQKNTDTKKFLNVKFRENKNASKNIQFQIEKKQVQGEKNSVIYQDYSLVKFEESERQNFIEKTDFIIQKTESQIFNTAQTEKKITVLSQELRKTQKQEALLTRSSTRSSFASYDAQYKALSIQRSSFVQIKHKKFQFSYELLEKIGQGAFGNVFKTRQIKTNQIRAVKILKKNMLKMLGEAQKLHMQLNILKSLDHPNVIKIYDVFHTSDLYYVVTQYCSGGTLQKYISDHQNNMDQDLIKIVMRQLLNTLTYLHSQSIIHRDIKLQNIVFDINPELCSSYQDVQIKLLDFGLSMKAKFQTINKQIPCKGTPIYMAPEVLNGKYSFKCDVWSSGVMLFFLLTKQIPFKATDVDQMYIKIANEHIDFEKPNFKNLQQDVKQLLKRMLQKDFLKRISAKETLNSKWFQQAIQTQKKTETELMFKKLSEYKKENNFITLIESYLVHLKSNDKDRKKMISLFQRIDKNNNGTIDLQQLEDIFPNKNYRDDEKKYLKELINKIDKDSSGKIQISQFLTVLSDRSKLFVEEYLEEAFQFLDSDKNGFIEKKQLKRALEGCEAEQYEIIWKDIDSDIDNKISRRQFFDYFLRLEEIKVE